MVYNGQTAYGSQGESHFYKTKSPIYSSGGGFPKIFNAKWVTFNFDSLGVIVYIKVSETPVFSDRKSIGRVASAVIVNSSDY